MSKITKATNNKTALSSTITIAVLFVSLALIIFLPNFFTTFPASLKTIVLYFTSLITFTFLCLVIIRRPRLFLSFSPLFPYLILLIAIIFFSTILKNFAYPEKSFLGYAGQIISFGLIALCSSFLIKSKKNTYLTQTLIFIATATALLCFILTLNQTYSFMPPSFLSIFSNPTLYFNLQFLGLASLLSYFFKKNKLKINHFLFFLIIVTGIIFNTYLYFSSPKSFYPNFSTSFATAINQTFHQQKFNLKTLILGSSSQQYNDIYYCYQLSNEDSFPYQQAISTPLTIFSLFGLTGLIAWLALLIKTLTLCFNKKTENQYLYFILFSSFIVQFFTPIFPSVLLIQAIIIAFAVNKNKKTLINFQLSTILDHSEEKSPSSKDKSKNLIYFILFFSCLSLLYAGLKIGQSYLAYYYQHQALKQEENLNQFYHYSQNAVEAAPFIADFNRFAALANLEIMLDQIRRHADRQGQEQALQYYNKSLEYAQKAIAIEPNNAINHQLLAGLYREVLPFLSNEHHQEALNQIRTSLATALLLQPQNQNLNLSLGGLYHAQGNLDEAKKMYLLSYQLNPQHLLTNYQLGTLYAQQGEYILAKTHYQNALKHLNPQDPNYSQNHQVLTKNITELP